METFKKKVRSRRNLFTVFLALLLVLLAYLLAAVIKGSPLAAATSHEADFMAGFQVGFLFGLVAIMVVQIIFLTRALKSETELRKLYIKETDEREQLIAYKVGQRTFITTLFALSAATIVASFFSATVFFTLVITLVGYSLIALGMKLYVRKTN